MANSYDALKDEKIAFIAAFDDDGNVRVVIDTREEGRDAVTVIDEKTRQRPIPPDTFVDGKPLSLTLHKIEPLQMVVYEPLGAGARGRKRLFLHAHGNPIPHP